MRVGVRNMRGWEEDTGESWEKEIVGNYLILIQLKTFNKSNIKLQKGRKTKGKY